MSSEAIKRTRETSGESKGVIQLTAARSHQISRFLRLDFFLLVVSQIFLKIKKLERNSKIIDRRLEREEREEFAKIGRDRGCI